MVDLKEMLNECFVLVDTCTFSNIINGNWNEKEYNAFNNILSCENKPLVSDLSFVELISGLRNGNELKKLLKDFNGCEFLVYGHIEEIKKCVQSTDFERTSEEDFILFKNKLLNIKCNFLKGIFKEILRRYCILYFGILEVIDPSFFGGILNSYVSLLFENGEYANFCEKIYYDIVNGKVTSKNILFDCANSFGDTLLPIIKTNYICGDIFRYVIEKEVEKKLSKYTSKFINFIKKKYPNEIKNISTENNCLIFLMKYLKKKKLELDLEEEIFDDSINYVVVSSGFCTGKFDINDLVDLYNVSLIGSNNNFKYYTNEKRWNRFIELERNINNRLIEKEKKVEKMFYDLH